MSNLAAFIRKEVTEHIRSGKITREKWNEALRLAHQIAPHLGRR